MNTEQANRGGLHCNQCLWDNFIHRLDMDVFRHRFCAGTDLRFSFQLLFVVDFLRRDHCFIVNHLEFVMIRK